MTGSSQVDLLTLVGGKNLQIAVHLGTTSFNHGVEFVVAATRTVVKQAHGAGAGLSGKLQKVVGSAVILEGVVFLVMKTYNKPSNLHRDPGHVLPAGVQDSLGMFGVRMGRQVRG